MPKKTTKIKNIEEPTEKQKFNWYRWYVVVITISAIVTTISTISLFWKKRSLEDELRKDNLKLTQENINIKSILDKRTALLKRAYIWTAGDDRKAIEHEFPDIRKERKNEVN